MWTRARFDGVLDRCRQNAGPFSFPGTWVGAVGAYGRVRGSRERTVVRAPLFQSLTPFDFSGGYPPASIRACAGEADRGCESGRSFESLAPLSISGGYPLAFYRRVCGRGEAAGRERSGHLESLAPLRFQGYPRLVKFEGRLLTVASGGGSLGLEKRGGLHPFSVDAPGVASLGGDSSGGVLAVLVPCRSGRLGRDPPPP
jgi:hypothetical protein